MRMNGVFTVLLAATVWDAVTGKPTDMQLALEALRQKTMHYWPLLQQQVNNIRDKLPTNNRYSRQLALDKQLPQLAETIQDFLKRVVPNQNLVNDLIGYVSTARSKLRRSF